MHEILRKDLLAPRVTRFVVRAREVARARRAGQFVIVRPRDDAERIPLPGGPGGGQDHRRDV